MFSPPASSLDCPILQEEGRTGQQSGERAGARHGCSQKYLVSNHPSGVNRVRCRAVTPEDRLSLVDYGSRRAAVRVDGLNRPGQKAFWINLHNALTVRVILEHYP